MPASADDTFRQAVAAFQAGRLGDAEQHFKAVLRLQPENIAALNILAVVLTALQKFAEAEKYYETALRLNPNSDATLYNFGIVLKALGKPAEALRRFSEALNINPGSAETWNNRGTAFNDIKDYDSALRDFDEAINRNPAYAEAFCNKARSLGALMRYDEALAALDRALALRPNLDEAWLGRATICAKLKRYDEALSAYDKALALKPDFAEAWIGRGNICAELHRIDHAVGDYRKALALNPDVAEVWTVFGNLLAQLKRYDEALAAYDKAIGLAPDLVDPWIGKGNIFQDIKRPSEAFAAFERVLALRPDVIGAEGGRLHAKMQLCDWSDFDTECAHLIASVEGGALNTPPFPFLTVPSSAEDQLACAKLCVAIQYPPSEHPIWQGERYNHQRIRVAYLSSDFYQHATAVLMAAMFKCHDKSRFEVTAISTGPDDGSDMRKQLEQSFDRFIDASGYGDDQIGKTIRELEIDVLVDLKGFTGGARTGILARRPAPIQVSYLGYPGTMGAPYIDYILADGVVIPEHQRRFYSEKIACLPHSYQVNDKRPGAAATPIARTEFGLPPTGFVFCCFNNNYKITPRVFDSWMRVLGNVDGSVLWLLEDNTSVVKNLRTEALKRGISGTRLIFAQRASLPDHMARHRAANLFLDTLPYNAHTTASDALWAGLPVLTCLGETFAGRVAASVLNAIGLPELVAATPEAYEQMAIELATQPDRLAAIKHKLEANRLTAPLFDTELFTEHIEAAFAAMHERHQAGLAPDHLTIAP
jgi:protein O-GlcNAc transferase